MRVQDEEKRQALFEATVKLVNAVGFDSSSVSKIAKEAGVSPSTLYVYHANKEDLLVSTYVTIKRELAQVVLQRFDDSLPMRDIVHDFCVGVYDYVSANPGKGMYLDQFSNTPYTDLVDHEALNEMYAPVMGVIQRGVEQKVLKNVKGELLAMFCFVPFMRLANPRHCGKDCAITREDVEIAFDMAWDAIKY